MLLCSYIDAKLVHALLEALMTVRQRIELLASPFNNNRSVVVFLALVGFSITFSHHVYAAGDAKRGQQVAEKWCATCHETSPGSLRLDKTRPASFQEIAGTPGMNELALRVFFQTPHKEMPNFVLTNNVRDDLTAYITGLKRK